ncbi:hypothetical protein Tco_1578801 [Tanacetum coccineum]
MGWIWRIGDFLKYGSRTDTSYLLDGYGVLVFRISGKFHPFRDLMSSILTLHLKVVGNKSSQEVNTALLITNSINSVSSASIKVNTARRFCTAAWKQKIKTCKKICMETI